MLHSVPIFHVAKFYGYAIASVYVVDCQLYAQHLQSTRSQNWNFHSCPYTHYINNMHAVSQL